MNEITKEALFGNAKSLSPEAKEKRKTINIKIFKFGCLPIIGVFIFIMILSFFSNKNEESSNVQDDKIGLNDATRKKIIKNNKSEIERILKSVTTEYDDFENTTFYYHINQPKYTNSNAFYLIVGLKNNQYFGKLIVRYSGEDWLFVKRIIVKCDDIKFNLNTNKVNRDNSSGSVWEWIDIPFDNSVQDVVRLSVKSNLTKIRFEGDQYSYDYTLSQKDIDALVDMYNLIKYGNELYQIEHM